MAESAPEVHLVLVCPVCELPIEQQGAEGQVRCPNGHESPYGWWSNRKQSAMNDVEAVSLEGVMQHVRTPRGVMDVARGQKPAAVDLDPVRMNVGLSDRFDVELEHLEASTLTYDWVSRFIGVPVKRLFKNCVDVPTVHLGSFLSALEEALAKHQQKDLRNIAGAREEPPAYEVIELNSKSSRDFLIDGIQFMEEGVGEDRRYVLRREPRWWGMHLTLYTSYTDRDFNSEILDEAWRGAIERSFLKGEAFSISGSFIKPTTETWDDVFLSADNRKPMERLVQTINAKGKAMPNRGIVMLGPPGTGKTLTARIIRNHADCTFIWVSARDFYRLGTYSALSSAFDLSRMFAPTVLLMEDIDNWLSDHSIDFLKTEMDGFSQSSGVATILTTNYPERFPEALIDRPGRFHDVLQFSHPDESIRTQMLRKWLPSGITDKTLKQIAKETEGFSGAHIKELASFATVLASETDGMTIDSAVQQALSKVKQQREMVEENRSHRQVRFSAEDGAVMFGVSPPTFSEAKAKAEPQIVVEGAVTNDVRPDSGTVEESQSENVLQSADLLRRVQQSGHPTAGGYPIVSDVDTVMQEGSFRGSDMSVEFVAVTRRPNERNRHGSMVQIAPSGAFKGLDPTNWEAHRGTWLFGHGLAFHLPIGNSFNKRTSKVEYGISKNRMTARLFFSQVLPEAEVIAALVEEGVLNTASIQFLPSFGRMLDPVEINVPEGMDTDGLVSFGPEVGFDFLSSDLYEISVVPVPADPHAIRKGIELGHVRGAKVTQALLPVMQMMAGTSSAMSGWTPSQSAKRAEFRFYESMGEYTREIVCPDEQSLLRVMQAAGAKSPVTAAVMASEATIDYEALAGRLQSECRRVAKPPIVTDTQAEQLRSAIADQFAALNGRIDQNAERIKLLTGAVD